MSRYWQIKWPQEVTYNAEVLSSTVEFMNKILQTDDPILAWEKKQKHSVKFTDTEIYQNNFFVMSN